MTWDELVELKKDKGICFAINFMHDNEIAYLDISYDSVKNRKGGILLPGYHRRVSIRGEDISKPFLTVINKLFNELTEEYEKDRDFTLGKKLKDKDRSDL